MSSFRQQIPISGDHAGYPVSSRTSASIVLTTALLLAYISSAAIAGYIPRAEFPKTDFDSISVDLDSIMSGGPAKDGIPAIDNPAFASADEVTDWLGADEPVVAFTHGGVAKAYPLQILIFHEIVNDTLAGKPVTVTFCPLCNASIVFDRTVGGQVLDFGTTGRLRNSDLIMYDRQTESWWQQFTGTGIIGKYNLTELVQLPSQIVSFSTFTETYPEGQILTRKTGYQRPYGNNPYRGYDDINSSPFLYSGELDKRLPPMERVLSIAIDKQPSLLISLSKLKTEPVLNLLAGDVPAVVLATTSAQSALDQSAINQSRKIPAAIAFARTVDNQLLSFVHKDGVVTDVQTGSKWNAFGHAVSGKLTGHMLKQIDRGVHFAFAWLAFEPDAVVFSNP